jgi:hypothetical protein
MSRRGLGPDLEANKSAAPILHNVTAIRADICYNSVPIHGGISHKLFPF